MNKIVAVASMVATVSAFRAMPSTSKVSSALKMSAEGLNGATAPFGYFDPLGFANGKSPADVKKFREAELKHGSK